jgi:hypothetical protein
MDINNKKRYRRFIYCNKNQREFQLYLEKQIWNEIKLFSNKYNLSQSDVVRSILISHLINSYVKNNFLEIKKNDRG